MFYTYYKKVGNKIIVRYKTDSGETKTKTIDFYKPKLFTTNVDQTNKWKSIYGAPLKQIEFNSFKEAGDYVTRYKHVDGVEIHGNTDYANQFVIELFEGQQPEYSHKKIRVGFTDIEVDCNEGFPKPEIAKWPINGYTTWDSFENKFYVAALTNENGDVWCIDNCDDSVKHLNIEYVQYDNERDLVLSLLTNIRDKDYDVVSGWNSEGFDIPYIINRANQLLGSKVVTALLSPVGRISSRSIINEYGNALVKFEVVGRSMLDYLQLYKKHIYSPRESYKLDYIATEELGEKKIGYEEAGSLHQLYRQDFQKFVDYNIQDVNLMVRLEGKLGLFQLTYAIAYYCLSNFEDTLGTVKVWEQLIAKFLYSKQIAPLARRSNYGNEDFEGAFVKDPIPGFYEWVIAFDLNGLYPHIEMQYNIGPETHIPYSELHQDLKDIVDAQYSIDDIINKKIDLSALSKHKVSMTANFQFYRQDKMSFFSEIKRELYDNRKINKNSMLEFERKKVAATDKKEKTEFSNKESFFNNMQLGLKVLLNGGYGAVGNSSFLYYKLENAEAITTSGQLVNKWTCNRINSFLQKGLDTKDNLWVYSDTDSGYFTLKDFVKQLPDNIGIQSTVDHIDNFSKTIIEPFIREQCQELCDYVNGYEQKMVWGREVIAQSAIWIAKKRYAMLVNDNEGTRYPEPKMKIMGLEAIRSSTPGWSRQFLRESYKYCLLQDQPGLYTSLDEMQEKYRDMSLHDIAIPRGVNDIQKWVGDDGLPIKRTPFNVKAAIAHNRLVEEKKLPIPLIENGNKIKMVPLKNPNPLRADMIAFDGFIPKEFGIEEYIDRDRLYDMAFMSPLKTFLHVLHWESEDTNTLF